MRSDRLLGLVIAFTLGCSAEQAGAPDAGDSPLDASDAPPPLGPDAAVDARAPDPPDAGPPPCDRVPSCAHTFQYPSDSVSSVELRGGFAAEGWSSGLQFTLNGVGDAYELTREFAHGERFEYKLVVNGSEWANDPDNPITAGEFDNSLFTQRCHDCPELNDSWRDTVLYFVFIDRFHDSDGLSTPLPGVPPEVNYQGGDLRGVTAKIEAGYFSELGVNALWLTSPVDNTESAPGSTAYHGYWPDNLDEVESRFGTEDDLHELIAAAHARGIRVVVDYVMNHVHEDSPVYGDHPDWFWPLELDGQPCICSEDDEPGARCKWNDPETTTRCWFSGYLPDFNFGNPSARAFSVGNAMDWIDRLGIDGFRLDAVKQIEEEWIRDLRDRLRSEVETGSVGFYLVGETYDGNRDVLKHYVKPSTMLDGQFDFPLRAMVLESIAMRQRPMSDLATFVASNDDYYATNAIMSTFLGNHDLPRAIAYAEDVPLFWDPWYMGDDHAWDNQPQLPAYDRPFQRLAVAYAFLMTSPGIPLIYYGDEIGMAGGGDPDNRQPMQWNDGALSPHQIWLRNQLRKLGQIRRNHAALRRGTRTLVAVTDDVYVYEMAHEGTRLYIALNRGDNSAPAPGLPSGTYQDLISDSTVATPINLLPRSAAILQPG